MDLKKKGGFKLICFFILFLYSRTFCLWFLLHWALVWMDTWNMDIAAMKAGQAMHNPDTQFGNPCIGAPLTQANHRCCHALEYLFICDWIISWTATGCSDLEPDSLVSFTQAEDTARFLKPLKNACRVMKKIQPSLIMPLKLMSKQNMPSICNSLWKTCKFQARNLSSAVVT